MEAMEANGRLQRSNNKCLWPEFLLPAAARDLKGRLERPNNRGLWRQTAGCNALTTNACGRGAWCKQPRGIWSVLGVLRVLRLANGRLERPNNRGLWRQWRQTAGCNAQARGIWSVLGVLRLAKGRLERPNNRGLWRKQPRGI